MSFTLAEASAQVGVNRSTLLRAIKAGKLSGNRDDAGIWHVEPVELFRVFEPASEQEESTPQHALADALVAELRAQLTRMERTIEDMRQNRGRTIARLDGDIADLRCERDEWREQFKRLSLPMPAAGAAPNMQQGSSDAGGVFPAKELVHAAAGPAAAPDAPPAAGPLRRTWRWLRSTG